MRWATGWWKMSKKKQSRRTVAPLHCPKGSQVASKALAEHVQTELARDGVLATARRAQVGREVIARVAARLPVRRATLALVAKNLNFRSENLAA